MAKTVAEQLVSLLLEAGVSRIYGIVGDSLNPVVDAVRRTGGAQSGGIDWIHVRHEEAAAFAAAAEAQVTGKLAVCAGSCGPGNLHLINGLYDAHRSGARVLALASHIPSAEIGSGFFQETHPDRLFQECSGYAELVSTPEQAPRVFRAAVQSSIIKSGVSTVVLPGDIAAAKSVAPLTELSLAGPARMIPPDDQVHRLAKAINDAEKVAIFAGYGARDAHDDIVDLADLVGAPVGHSLRGKESMQYDNPFDVGMTGLLGYGAAHAGIHDADLLILLGTDFPYSQFLPNDVTTAQVDTDAEVIGRRTAVQIPVHGDVHETVRALLPMVTRKSDRSYLNRWLDKHRLIMTKTVGAYTHNVDSRTPIHPEYVASLLDELADQNAIFTTDTGMSNVWVARYINATGHRQFLTSALHGSMANALPQAIGAKFAQPKRQVISVSGDGGLSMLLSELITVAAHRLPVKIIVFNNSTLGMVKAEMLVDGLPDFGVDVPAVDYAALAATLGFDAYKVTHPQLLREALTVALASDGPALIDVSTDPLALSVPPTITGEQVRGFALAMTKVVLNRGMGEAVALARSNLRNIPRP